jgi:hypothetical protein
MGNQDIRAYLNGLYFELNKDTLTVCSDRWPSAFYWGDKANQRARRKENSDSAKKSSSRTIKTSWQNLSNRYRNTSF